jgi:hypothetical protein
MSLRKNPMTPARLAANRRNAKKSTGPRTARGKSQSRLNSLRTGGRSRLYNDLLLALMHAPPCAVALAARSVLTPAQAAHPLFAELVDIFCQAEFEVGEQYRRLLSTRNS